MDPISIVLMVFFGIIALLLIGLTLIQEEQSEGIGSMFGGGSQNQIGNRRGNVLTRATSILGTLFLVVCFLFALNFRSQAGSAEKLIQENQDLGTQAAPQNFWENTVPAPAVEAPVVETSTDLEAPATEGTETAPADQATGN